MDKGRNKKKHSKTDNHIKLKSFKSYRLEESTPFSSNILSKYIFAVKEDVKHTYLDSAARFLYNNDNQDLIPPQIQKAFFWQRCKYGSCAHVGNAVRRRVSQSKLAYQDEWVLDSKGTRELH